MDENKKGIIPAAEEIADDALEQVSGGASNSQKVCGKCKSPDVGITGQDQTAIKWKCYSCGRTWREGFQLKLF